MVTPLEAVLVRDTHLDGGSVDISDTISALVHCCSLSAQSLDAK